MIKTIDITNFESAQEVFSIQIAAYKIEAAIIGSYDLPPLKETIETLQNCGESFLVITAKNGYMGLYQSILIGM